VAEPLTVDLMKPMVVPQDPQVQIAPPAAAEIDPVSGPLLGPTPAARSRTYAAVGVSTRGKKGPVSRRVVVPLVPPPPPPEPPAIAYDEKAITVTWPAIGATASTAAPEEPALLPARIIGVTRPAITYNVYDATDPDAMIKLTAEPIAEPKYTDSRLAWGVQRCYTVRAAERVSGAIIEGDAAPARCETLADTFPPAAPKGVTAIPSDGAINLIWEPNEEKDLAGYLVLRGTATAGTLEPITPSPIQETSFKDGVERGVPYVYSVKAVDRAGNESPPSARVTETAR
jgi:hypothetical protein